MVAERESWYKYTWRANMQFQTCWNLTTNLRKWGQSWVRPELQVTSSSEILRKSMARLREKRRSNWLSYQKSLHLGHSCLSYVFPFQTWGPFSLSQSQCLLLCAPQILPKYLGNAVNSTYVVCNLSTQGIKHSFDL